MTQIVPQAAAAAALHVTDRAGMQPITHNLRGTLDLAAKQPHAAHVCCLMVSLVIPVIAWITTHLLTPKGWKAELSWLVDLQWTLYSQSGHMSTIDQGQIRESANQRPSF